MVEGLSKLFAGEFGSTGLLLGGLLVIFGMAVIFGVVHLSRERKKKDR